MPQKAFSSEESSAKDVLSEMDECEIRDGNDELLSELYARCNGRNNGEVKWMRNDLELVYSYKWTRDSDMIVDVKFKDKQMVEMPAVAG